MKVFLSWSQERSRLLADAFRDWLPLVIQSLEPWMSASDIPRGAQWIPELTTQLQNTPVGIFFLTPENLSSPWLHFEAGAVSMKKPRGFALTYLFEVGTGEVPFPLGQFQSTQATKEDTRKMLLDINRLQDRQLTERQLNAAFEHEWPGLESTLNKTRELRLPSGSATTLKDIDRMLKEAGIDVLAPLFDVKTNRERESRLLLDISADPSVPTFLDHLARQGSSEPTNFVGTAQVGALLTFLRDLGLVSIEGRNAIQPVSELASAFISSIGVHLEAAVDFIGGWIDQGSQNPEAQRTREILKRIEERRIVEVGIERARPCRTVSAALALIKARMGCEEVYLMQLSDSWATPYYWFIGGIMEARDEGEFESCLYREMREELNLRKADVASVVPFCDVVDKRISERLGALTEYHYKIFFVSLKPDTNSLNVLSVREPEVQSFLSLAKVTRRNKWFTLGELQEDSNLLRDAGPILAALIRCDASALPLSIDRPISP